MKRLFLFGLIGILLGCSLFLALYFHVSHQQDLDSSLNEAFIAYQKGENGKNLAERKQGFNSALEIYTELEKKYRPCYSSGKFFYNLGNTYFQLGEYPLALLYYYRSQSLQPRNSDVKRNLDVALEKLHVPKIESSTDIRRIFFFHTYFSLPERLQLFCYSGLAWLLVLSLMIQFPKTKSILKFISPFLGIIFFLFFISILYSRYIEPLGGVIIKATYLYRDKGKQYAKVSNVPSPSGLKVDILDVEADGKWLKILIADGTLGYIPNDTIRVVSCE